MRVTTTLLNGETLVADIPDATIAPPTRCSVLVADGIELEVHAGSDEAADFFLTSTGSSVTGTVRLRGGQDMEIGPLGGRGGQGLAFRVVVGSQRLFGSSPPVMTREQLAAVLVGAGIRKGRHGPAMAPSGAVAWSPMRTHDAALTVEVAKGSFLVDTRRAQRRPAAGEQRGVAVRGGRLSRSAPDERPFVVLEAQDVVAYGVPTLSLDVDALVHAMSTVELTIEQAP